MPIFFLKTTRPNLDKALHIIDCRTRVMDLNPHLRSVLNVACTADSSKASLGGRTVCLCISYQHLLKLHASCVSQSLFLLFLLNVVSFSAGLIIPVALLVL